MEKKLQGKDLMNVGIYTAIYFFVTFLVAMLAALAIITNVPVVSRIPFILMGR